MNKFECVFCRIAAGRAPSHRIWESDTVMAFLSLHPNTEGFTVVATKAHHPSYLFDMKETAFIDLVTSAKKVGKMLDQAFDDVGRTACIMEGFGVDHAHIKLFPMHGTQGPWRPIKSKVDKFFATYEGYVSSHDHQRADDDQLRMLAERIRTTGYGPE
ncbi:HIT family protein [Xylophilus sp. GOD-11R]|uniref:HIT family protein n=1 Tax=Xylophilus sp. GOD-11R TaxID=3089814 RepID=UPI00298C67E8|nr:HIT family protein [Xylophilus sp. GOD-11R]WPB59163.1 HIT family protein [Xylophilus sp. GOD-11R]